MGARLDDGFLARNAPDDDVQERSHEETEQRAARRDKAGHGAEGRRRVGTYRGIGGMGVEGVVAVGAEETRTGPGRKVPDRSRALTLLSVLDRCYQAAAEAARAAVPVQVVPVP